MIRIALALGLLSMLAPLSTAGHASPGPPRQTSIFYYPWYGSPRFDGGYLHWSQDGHVPPLDLATAYYPARGPYSSGDPSIVAAQMNDIAAAGINEVVSSWWGWGSVEDQRLPMVQSMATKKGLGVAVQIEPYGDRTAASVADDLAHLEQRGITRFFVYQPFQGIDEESWAAVLGATHGIQVLAQTTNVARAKAAGFAGVYTYDVSARGPSTFAGLCTRAHRAGLVCAPSVGPGYDALRATGDTHLDPRADGATYDAMWRAAIHAGADRITITSYNEWHEGTQIEPAQTPLPRRLSALRGGAASPVAAPYATYEGAYGFHGRKASRAYLLRTAYWTGLYRSGASVDDRAIGAAAGRKAGVRIEGSAMATTVAPALGASRTNLLLGARLTRLMAAVRATRDVSGVRWLGHDASETRCTPVSSSARIARKARSTRGKMSASCGKGG
jgi:hypothetical protein